MLLLYFSFSQVILELLFHLTIVTWCSCLSQVNVESCCCLLNLMLLLLLLLLLSLSLLLVMLLLLLLLSLLSSCLPLFHILPTNNCSWIECILTIAADQRNLKHKQKSMTGSPRYLRWITEQITNLQITRG